MSQSPDNAPVAQQPDDAARFREMEDALLGGKSPPEIDAAVELLGTFRLSTQKRIYLNQRVSEWKRFVQFLADRGFPRTILEIGTGRGGSTFFWSRLSPPNACIVTVDLNTQAGEDVAVYLRPEANPVHCITGDSTSAKTIDAVRQALGQRPVDLLYIDGDHSYEGVKSDFELYKQFCQPGSLIAFHDIHPDFFHSRGVKTACDSGLVYKFWEEVKAGHRFHEFVEEPRSAMDGFGIGVVEWVG